MEKMQTLSTAEQAFSHFTNQEYKGAIA